MVVKPADGAAKIEAVTEPLPPDPFDGLFWAPLVVIGEFDGDSSVMMILFVLCSLSGLSLLLKPFLFCEKKDDDEDA